VPFTPCHAAAVLPLVRTPLVPSALVVGSMAPDAPYYVPATVPLTTHALWSAVTVDVGIGLLLLGLWQFVLRRPAVAAAPAALRERLPGAPPPATRAAGHLRRAGLVLLSLATGSLTHVVWDAFTHRDRWGTGLVPWLQQVHGPLEGYRWAQYGSTVVGAVVLAWWVARWWRTTPREPEPPRRPLIAAAVAAVAWVAVAGTAAVVGTVAGAEQLVGTGPPDPRGAAFVAATRGAAAGAVVATALAVVAAWSTSSLRPWRPRGSPG